MNAFANVPDPTDFPSGDLRNLDSAARCPICSEFFDGPVSLACGHSFCSLCVRGTMAATSQSTCPRCRAPTTEGQLRPNPVLEEMVGVWQAARAGVLELTKRGEEPVRKKRKMSVESVSVPPTSSAGPSRTSSTDSRVSQAAGSGMVDCPVCSAPVAMASINAHIDSGCELPDATSPKKASAKSQWSTLMAPPKSGKGKAKASDNDRIPKTSYKTLKDKQIRELLKEYGLPDVGDRSTLEARHRQWAMLWNANLDKATDHRLSKEKLRQALTRWEREKNAPKREKPVVDDAGEHLKTHKDEFKKLVAKANPKKEVIDVD
ncbi:DNA repair protein [Mycena kentingensis (nom. inval.)]|nr:DNA repair protein [Mycena kentingensis (nom. inval.)]